MRKKIYQSPLVELVRVKLAGSVLDDPEVPVMPDSYQQKPSESLGKEHRFDDETEDEHFGVKFDLWN